jgi:hypothetical protein
MTLPVVACCACQVLFSRRTRRPPASVALVVLPCPSSAPLATGSLGCTARLQRQGWQPLACAAGRRPVGGEQPVHDTTCCPLLQAPWPPVVAEIKSAQCAHSGTLLLGSPSCLLAPVAGVGCIGSRTLHGAGVDAYLMQGFGAAHWNKHCIRMGHASQLSQNDPQVGICCVERARCVTQR